MEAVKKMKTLTGEKFKQRLEEEQCEKGKENHIKNINDFPGPILQYILSFLPTKDAVATCILSKKWQFLWTSISHLNFIQSDLGYYSRAHVDIFMNSIERVLQLRDSSSLESFSLNCCAHGQEFRIYTWISALVTRHNVQRLSLTLYGFSEAFTIPYCFFSCKSLTCFELNMPSTFKLPSSIRFSSLKILNLSSVVFSDEDATYQLFSSPVLETLSLKCCDWRNLKVVNITASQLLNLIIHEQDHDCDRKVRDDGEVIINRCEIFIFGKNLKFFEFHGKFFDTYCLHDSTSVAAACISVPSYNEKSSYYPIYSPSHSPIYYPISSPSYSPSYYPSYSPSYSNGVPACIKRAETCPSLVISNFLGELYNVKDLKLSSTAIELLASGQLEFLPMLNNLSSLKIDLGSMSCDSKALLKLLQNSPHLENLEFVEGIGLSCKNDARLLDPVPPCFLSQLRNIKIRQLVGTWEELYVVKSLFDRAEVLEKMVISFSRSVAWSLSKQSKISELLLDYSKKSRSCQLIFV